MFTLSKLYLRYIPPTLVRIVNYTTARPTVIFKNPVENVEEMKIEKVKEIKPGGLVAAAFASLQEDNNTTDTKSQPSIIEKKISKAENINELLSIHEKTSDVSRPQALKIVSVLAQWSASGKIKLNDFESDSRFIKLCKILSRNKTKQQQKNALRGDDLAMVIGVASDDEAAKLIASITLPQMIKIMTTLASKKRRSTPLLRSLAFNISRSSTKLDLKQCADLLYSVTLLNFPEPVLLERVSNDISEGLENNTDRSAVVGSILTSVGLLRYKDPAMLDVLSDWILKHFNICRPQDIAALFQTLAVVNYHPANSENTYKTLIPQLNIADVSKPSAWLDLIWSLVLLEKATNEHISSVLNSNFIKQLQSNSLSSGSKTKLLNINAVAKNLISDYSGPFLEENSPIKSLLITRTNEKQILVKSILDSLGSLFSSNTYLKSNINSGMGFLIDGECVIDKKCNPVPVSMYTKYPNHIKVAFLAYDYHDTCRGDNSPHGGNVLATKLLKSQGYQLVIVPYTEFHPKDKLIQRVQFLEKQLKFIASSV